MVSPLLDTDLVIPTLEASPTTVLVREEFILTATIQNSGAENSPFSTSVIFFRSKDRTITMDYTVIGVNHAIPALKTGSNVTFSIEVTEDTVGIYYYGACVAEIRGESSTDNNCSSAVSVEVIEVDRNKNGLIEIDSLQKLHNIRYNLAGTGYKSSPTAIIDFSGCPNSVCNGYELVKDLDFDEDKDGSTWTTSDNDGDGIIDYFVDEGDSASYFMIHSDGSGGWRPIGDKTTPFNSIFEGNGYTIDNLVAVSDESEIGLFGNIGALGDIRSVSMSNALVMNNGENSTNIGILVGYSLGIISSSDTSGRVIGGDGIRDRVGGLVGYSKNNITTSYAIAKVGGGKGDYDSVGGLVGEQNSGNITASYVTGVVDGGGGNFDSIGGLVGEQNSGNITASYANVIADGGSGNFDYVGGLVGYARGNIIASYAIGPANGRSGENDEVGGLVGYQGNGTIIASYATGNVDGGEGNRDFVGRLVGYQDNGSIMVSYGFGKFKGETTNDGGKPPSDVESVAELVLDYAKLEWDQASTNTLGAWDFGSNSQSPALKYADYDGDGTKFICDTDVKSSTPTSTIIIPNCGQFLPAQSPSFYVNSEGAKIRIGWRNIDSYYYILSRKKIDDDGWSILRQGNAIHFGVGIIFSLTDALPKEGFYIYRLQLCKNFLIISCSDSIKVSINKEEVDKDGNGLIEIDSLQKLHNIRYNLAGTGYKSLPTATNDSSGCPHNLCRGYELVQDLDFDKDKDGSAWATSDKDGDGIVNYFVDEGDSAPYFMTHSDGSGGWQPIGDRITSFNSIFEGNGYTIYNLAVISSGSEIGLFGGIGTSSDIRKISVTNALIINNGNSSTNIGVLAGYSVGSISSSDTNGRVIGGDGARDKVGGLVGYSKKTITASYMIGLVDGGKGDYDFVGGLVGEQDSGSITASYFIGRVVGGNGKFDSVGGLIGKQNNGSIVASYAIAALEGGEGANDYVGGLVGEQENGSITASYTTMTVEGGEGANDYVGGLVGEQKNGSITASYTTGRVDGGIGNRDSVGGLIGNFFGNITKSYRFGNFVGEVTNDEGKHSSIINVVELTLENAGKEWNQASIDTLGAWDFGTNFQPPALKYADYDGDGTKFICDKDVTRGTPASIIIIPNCETLLPAQSPSFYVNSEGEKIHIGWRNIGSSYYILSRRKIDDTDWVILRQGNASLFGEGGIASVTDTLPLEVAYVYQLQICESSSLDSCLNSVEFVIDNRSDLEVSLLEVDSTEVLFGERFTLTATIQNLGSADASSTSVTFYRSSNATIDKNDISDDISIDTIQIPSLIARDIVTGNIEVLADNLGITYYIACVASVRGESSTTNNCSKVVNVQVVAPDLELSLLEVASTEVLFGERFTLTATIQNLGSADASSTSVTFYRSSDATIDKDDISIDTIQIPSLIVRDITTSNIEMLADNLGITYYIACVVSVHGEISTTNNCSKVVSVQVVVPDLELSLLEVASTEVLFGERFTLTATIQNLGSAGASSTSVTFYRSSDATIDKDDISIDTIQIPSLIVRDIATSNIEVLADNLGIIYYIACVASVRGEISTKNNCSKVVSVQVVVPDLELSLLEVDLTEVLFGERFTLTAIMQNLGSADASSTSVTFYRSSDATIDKDDISIDTIQIPSLIVRDIAIGNIEVQADNLGITYYIACVASVRGEISTTNNCSKVVNVQVVAPDLELSLLEIDSTATSEVLFGERFTLTATIQNTTWFS